MNPNLQDQLNEMEVKIEAIQKSVKKTESYLKWTFWVTVFFLVAPVIGVMLILPSIISSYTTTYSGLL